MDHDRARELLARERSRIEDALVALGRQSDQELATIDQHPADQGTEMFERERDEGVAGALREELAAVERAERRLDEGTYGFSVESGEPIPDGRLEAMPWAERTVEEEERAEAAQRLSSSGP